MTLQPSSRARSVGPGHLEPSAPRRGVWTSRLLELQLAGMLVVATASLLYRRGLHAADLDLYWRYARSVLSGAMPYVDFHPEYPPLALLYPLLPAMLAPGFWPFVFGYMLQSALVGLLLTVVLRSIRGNADAAAGGEAAWTWAAAAVIGAPIFLFRFDLLPALLSILALRAFLDGRAGRAGIWIALGTATKLYPIVLGPVFAVHCMLRRDWRAVTRLALAFTVALAVTIAPFLAASPTGFLRFLTYHVRRGIQLESLPAGWILLRHVVTGEPVAIVHNFGAAHLVASGTAPLIAALPVAFLVSYGVGLAVTVRRFLLELRVAARIAPGTLVRGCLLALLPFLLCNKSLSPQYLAWILPFMALAGRRTMGWGLAVVAVTLALFPFLYVELEALATAPILLLNVRNLTLVGIFLGTAWSLLGRPDGAGRASSPREG